MRRWLVLACLLSPALVSAQTTRAVTFEWAIVTPPDAGDIAQLDRDGVIEVTCTPAGPDALRQCTSVVPTGPAAVWRVREGRSGGWGDWSPPVTAAVPPVLPGQSPGPFTLTFVQIPLILPLPTGDGTLGRTTAGGDSFPMASDRAILTRVTATETGTITGCVAWFESLLATGTGVKCVLHASVAGVPGPLVASSPTMPVPSGGGRVAGTMTGNLLPGDYWLGVVGDGFTARVSEQVDGTGLTVMANGTYPFAVLPATWPGTTTTYAVTLAVSVTYTRP